MVIKKESVAVCGGCGFIGSHLVQRLTRSGHDVKVICNSNHQTRSPDDAGKMTIVRINIKEDPKQLRDALRDCSTVFHLAAVNGDRIYLENHPASCCTNMAIDNIIFENAVKAGVNHIQYCSSALAYPVSAQQLLTEDMVDFNNLQTPDQSYGFAKLMGEYSLHMFRQEFGIKGSIVRLSTVYGPWQDYTYTVPALILRAISHTDPFRIYGDGNQSRNFTYVDDVAECMIRASRQISDCTAVNVATRESTTINELISLIFKITNWQPKNISYDLSKPAGNRSRLLDNLRAEKLLDFKQTQWTTIEDGMKATVSWFQSNQELKSSK